MTSSDLDGDFKTVIARLIKRAGLNPTQFARKLGYANSGAIFLMLQGKKSIPLNDLDQWFDVLHLSDYEKKRLRLKGIEEFAPVYVQRLVAQIRGEFQPFALWVAKAFTERGMPPPPIPDVFGDLATPPPTKAGEGPGKPPSSG
jgi:hypothetical protein